MTNLTLITAMTIGMTLAFTGVLFPLAEGFLDVTTALLGSDTRDIDAKFVTAPLFGAGS